jgi:hypothetical protein
MIPFPNFMRAVEHLSVTVVEADIVNFSITIVRHRLKVTKKLRYFRGGERNYFLPYELSLTALADVKLCLIRIFVADC